MNRCLFRRLITDIVTGIQSKRVHSLSSPTTVCTQFAGSRHPKSGQCVVGGCHQLRSKDTKNEVKGRADGRACVFLWTKSRWSDGTAHAAERGDEQGERG